jgi:hypothetical protein
MNAEDLRRLEQAWTEVQIAAGQARRVRLALDCTAS